jgi:hypothetical protein
MSIVLDFFAINNTKSLCFFTLVTANSKNCSSHSKEVLSLNMDISNKPDIISLN